MNIKRVTLTTLADGSLATDVLVQGEILSIGLLIGNLSTPDLAITDKTFGTAILSKAGIAADTQWHPRAKTVGVTAVALAAAAGPPAVDDVYAPIVAFGSVHVTLAGAGATTTGTLLIASRG